MNWQDVQRLRKTGELEQARNAAQEILAVDPGDFKTKSQYEWVIFDCIKLFVANMRDAVNKDRPVDARDVDDVMAWIDVYRSLNPRIPELVCSNILAQLAKVVSHLPQFSEIIRWVGVDGLRLEDWQPNQYQGKTFPSLAMNISRALCKGIKANPEADEEQIGLALQWADRVRKTAKGDDALWLDWDMAILLRRTGDFQGAAELLAGVVKAKRNEFWVWAEAGRLYQSEQPELALACYCRALECPAEPKFLVRAHRELAALLAEQEEYAQASREVAITLEIRQSQGWPVGREMEGMVASAWYDAAAEGSDEPKYFYAKHSPAALALCFDVVETKAANFLGLLVPHMPNDPLPGRKPRPLPRFVIKDSNGHAWSLVGPGMKKLQFEVGNPLTVVIGRQNGDDRQTIVHVSGREDGRLWDCLEPGAGVVTREATVDTSMKVLIVDSGEEGNANNSAKSLRTGDGVRFGFARNPKNNRAEVFNVEQGELPKNRLVRGQLRRHPIGFGFIEEAFVPAHIVESVASAVNEVEGLAIYAFNPSRGEYGWRVVQLHTK